MGTYTAGPTPMPAPRCRCAYVYMLPDSASHVSAEEALPMFSGSLLACEGVGVGGYVSLCGPPHVLRTVSEFC